MLLVAAIENFRSGRVPNLITFSAFLSGLLVAILTGAKVEPFSQLGGGLVSSLESFLVVAVSLIALYSQGVIPAGCVKMQLAVSVWIGCVFPVQLALWINLATTIGAVVLAASAYGIACHWHAATIEPNSDDNGERTINWFPIQSYASLGAIFGLFAAVTLS